MKHSVLLDSGADLLLYGMGERSVVEVADALNAGIDIKDITFVNGSVYKTKSLENVYDYQMLPSMTKLKRIKRHMPKFFISSTQTQIRFSGKRLVEKYNDHEYVVQNPAAMRCHRPKWDRVYALNYMRTWHPMYDAAGGRSGYQRSEIQPCQQQGVLWGLQFLRIKHFIREGLSRRAATNH